LVGQKITGTNIVEREVSVPDGKEIVEVKKGIDPIYDNVADQWPCGRFGENGMVLLALLKSGIPESEQFVSEMIRTLENHLNAYGVPDTTWDVAWLAAAFANVKDERFKKIRELLINRVLDGQITEGPGRGLWGPICINTKVLAAMLSHEESVNKELANFKEDLAKDPDMKSKQKRVQDAESYLKEWADVYSRVTQQGLRFQEITASYTVTAPGERGIVIPGLPMYIYNQTLADIESTALATYALREAWANGCLPTETSRPELPKARTAKERLLLPGEAVNSILARCAAGITTYQKKEEGNWDECNIHQPIQSFNALGLPSVEPNTLLTLPSQQSLVSSANGYAALVDMAQVVGLSTVFRKYGDSVVKGRKSCIAAVEQFLDNKTGDTPVGRLAVPYDFIFRAGGVERRYGGIMEDRRDLWNRLAYRLVKMQNSIGTWSKGMSFTSPSSAWWQYRDMRARQAHEAAQAKLPEKSRVPYNPAAWQNVYRGPLYSSRNDIVATAYAVLFLAEGVRAPLAGYIAETEDSDAPVSMMKTVEALDKKNRFPLACMTVTSETSPREIRGLPLIFVSNSASLAEPRITKLLTDYVRQGGLVIAETTNSLTAKDLESRLKTLVDDARPSTLPIDDTFEGPKPTIRGFRRPGGEEFAAIFPLAKQQPAGAGEISVADAIQTVTMLIQRRVHPKFFQPDYVTVVEDAADIFAMRINAITKLDEMLTAPTRAVAPRPTAAADGATTNQPAATPASGAAPAATPAQPAPAAEAPATKAADEEW
jgi:hypothetical protein